MVPNAGSIGFRALGKQAQQHHAAHNNQHMATHLWAAVNAKVRRMRGGITREPYQPYSWETPDVADDCSISRHHSKMTESAGSMAVQLLLSHLETLVCARMACLFARAPRAAHPQACGAANPCSGVVRGTKVVGNSDAGIIRRCVPAADALRFQRARERNVQRMDSGVFTTGLRPEPIF